MTWNLSGGLPKPDELKAMRDPAKINRKTIGKDFLLNIKRISFDDILKCTNFEDEKIQSELL
jgi:hypothetical protein